MPLVNDPNLFELTKRERQVLILLAQSYKLKQIAHELNLSYHTVDSHKTRLMKKLDLHDIAAVTRYAILHGYVDARYTGKEPKPYKKVGKVAYGSTLAEWGIGSTSS